MRKYGFVKLTWRQAMTGLATLVGIPLLLSLFQEQIGSNKWLSATVGLAAVALAATLLPGGPLRHRPSGYPRWMRIVLVALILSYPALLWVTARPAPALPQTVIPSLLAWLIGALCLRPLVAKYSGANAGALAVIPAISLVHLIFYLDYCKTYGPFDLYAASYGLTGIAHLIFALGLLRSNENLRIVGIVVDAGAIACLSLFIHGDVRWLMLLIVSISIVLSAGLLVVRKLVDTASLIPAIFLLSWCDFYLGEALMVTVGVGSAGRLWVITAAISSLLLFAYLRHAPAGPLRAKTELAFLIVVAWTSPALLDLALARYEHAFMLALLAIGVGATVFLAVVILRWRFRGLIAETLWVIFPIMALAILIGQDVIAVYYRLYDGLYANALVSLCMMGSYALVATCWFKANVGKPMRLGAVIGCALLAMACVVLAWVGGARVTGFLAWITAFACITTAVFWFLDGRNPEGAGRRLRRWLNEVSA